MHRVRRSASPSCHSGPFPFSACLPTGNMAYTPIDDPARLVDPVARSVLHVLKGVRFADIYLLLRDENICG